MNKDKKKAAEQARLDSKQQALLAAWNAAPGEQVDECAVSQLRWLLENFSPLQALIRDIARPGTGEAAAPPIPLAENVRAEATTSPEHPDRADPDLQKYVAACKELKKEVSELKAKLRQKDAALQKAQTQLSVHQKNQDDIRRKLAVLRTDAPLAQQLALHDLPIDDVQALARTIAVLSQHESLQRLGAILKERCEAESRPASHEELALLQTALIWHNHNWRARPFRLIEVAPSSAFQFAHHQRSQHSPAGETVVELYLPGITHDNGQPLFKALVRTN